MKYGFFDDAAKEYVITNPKTPAKWINYVGTLGFGGFVDHTGGALICKGDPSLNRITKYIQQMPASDFKGETLYIRIKNESGYKVFSPFFVPTLDNYDKYECHIGLGYTKIVSEFYGIRTECTIFVPADNEVEIRDIRVTNVSKDAKSVDVIPVIEYTHFDAVKQFTNADWVPQTMQSRCKIDKNGNCILIQYPFMMRDIRVNYFTSNFPVTSFETDRKRFLGNNEYGTWAHPGCLDKDELESKEAERGDTISALMHRLGVLKPGEQRRIITQLGQKESLDKALPEIKMYRDPANVDASLGKLSAFYQKLLSVMKVSTPDAGMNSMLNIHNPRQCFITFNWSRYLSYYQLGMGTRGLGFRDSSQDVMGVIDRIPEKTKELLIKLLSVQNRSGNAMHQFNPLSMDATNGDAHEMPDRPQFYGDDHLWIVMAVIAYLKETGDMPFLEQTITFYKSKKEVNSESATVLEHLIRALNFTKENIGRHGLPLLGFADWNDTVNLPSGAESMFNACLYGVALREMIDLSSCLGKSQWVSMYTDDYESMKKSVNENAWDGEWYIRYFNADGSPLGSKSNEQGKIYLNAQSWPVLAGFAPSDRAKKAMEFARLKLNTKNGIKLSWPGFNGFDPSKGGITTYPPGAKENGGIFLHTNPWAIIAETVLGNGERAFEYYDQINPAKKNEIIDEYEVEPYVYAQNILGDEHPQFGLGRNSWLSGTSSWAYQSATKYILGIQPGFNGLVINPCIPPSWDSFKVERVFRGTTYIISVKNPSHVSNGVKSIQINEIPIDGNVIPFQKKGDTITVTVVLG